MNSSASCKYNYVKFVIMRRQEFLTEFPAPSGVGRWWFDKQNPGGVYCDQTLATWFGFKSKALFIPCESPGAHPALSQFVHHIQQLIISKGSQASLTCDAMPSGLPGHFRVESFATRDPPDETSNLYGFLIDVSAQVGLERQIDQILAENQRVIEQHRAIIEADTAEKARRLLRLEMGFGHTWVVDVESQQVQPDEAFAAWAGWRAGQWYPAEDMLSGVPEDFHEEFRALLKEHCTDLAEGDTFSFEHPQIRWDTNQRLWVKVYGKISTLEGRRQIHGQVIDITEQHQKQLELEQLARRQRELFGLIGHELLTPIAALQMHFQHTDVDYESRGLIQKALSVTDRMQRVVNGSHSFGVTKSLVRPVNIIRQQIERLQEKNHDCAVWLDFDQGLEDRELILRAEDFAHCVFAALADSVSQPQVSEVKVMCSVNEMGQDCQLVVTVEDNRRAYEQGIARGSDVASKDCEDLGFGLLDVEAGAARLGATYQITDKKQGRRIRLELKTRMADSQPTEGPVSAKIMLVEDDPFLMTLICRMLESVGHEVTSAANGEEAVHCLQSSQFDAVLTDLSMPIMNGHDLIRWIRERDVDLPIGVLTASVLGSEITSAIELGANLALQKPIERDTLLRSMTQLLNMPHSTDLPRNQSK